MTNHPATQLPTAPVAEHPLDVPPRPPPAVVAELTRTARVPLGNGRTRSLEHLETHVLAGIAERAEPTGECSITLDDIAEMSHPRLGGHTAFRLLDVLVTAGVLRITSQVRASFGIALTDPSDSPQELTMPPTRPTTAPESAAPHAAQEDSVHRRGQPAPKRRTLSFRLSDPADRARLQGALELAAIRREDEADLTRTVAGLLRPLGITSPVVQVRQLGDTLATFGLGAIHVIPDTATVTISAAVMNGLCDFAHPRNDIAGYRRFVRDLAAHEVVHFVARVRAERGQGPPVDAGDHHGAAFVQAAAVLSKAHRRTLPQAGWLPAMHASRAPGWPVSMRQLSYYGASVDRDFLMSVKRREPSS